MTSGAIQGKVPTTVMWVVWERNLDAPKSQIWNPQQREQKKKDLSAWIKKRVYGICVVMITGAAIRTFSTLSAVITTVEERAEESRCVAKKKKNTYVIICVNFNLWRYTGSWRNEPLRDLRSL